MSPHSEETWAKIAQHKARAYERHRETCTICGKDDKHCSEGLDLAQAMVDASIKEFLEPPKWL